MAQQMLADFYGCNSSILDNMENIRSIAHQMCDEIHAEIIKECYHKFEPVGITYMAVISTSHFSVHTWPEYQYAAVDIFSCDETIPREIAEKMARFFEAEETKLQILNRRIGA